MTFNCVYSFTVLNLFVKTLIEAVPSVMVIFSCEFDVVYGYALYGISNVFEVILPLAITLFLSTSFSK